MKTKKTRRTAPRAFTALLAFLALVVSSFAQNETAPPLELAPEEPHHGPTLLARDITAETEEHVVRLVFPAWLDIDVSTLGDGDLKAYGPNGYVQEAEFVGVTATPSPYPLPLDSLPADAEATALVAQPAPLLVATYQFAGPNGNWTSSANGVYRVRLVANEIATSEGRFLPAKFLGGFRCAIRPNPGTPIQPQALHIDFGRIQVNDTGLPGGDVHYFAEVTMIFDTPHVAIDWGTLQPTATGWLAPITALTRPVVSPGPVPVLTAEDVATANLAPAPVPGTPVLAADGLTHLPRYRHLYRLGPLDPGTYNFTAQVNGITEGFATLVVPPIPPIDEDPPEAELSVRNIIHPNDRPHRMAVVYKDRSPIDLATLGDGDLVVFSPCLHHPHLAHDPAPCDWQAQRVRLVDVIPLTDDRTKVKAIYEVEPPRGGWTHLQNGFYPVVWRRGEVCDTLGNCNRRQRLGGFEVAIDPSDPPIPAKAEIRVDSSDPRKVLAKVHVKFDGYYRITSQSIRRQGNRILLLAHAEPVPVPAVEPMPPFPQEDLLYEIGPLEKGDYIAGFIMNRFLYDTEKFRVAPSPPIPAEVTLAIDASDPTNVTAQVTIQFETPHVVSQGAVERQGHRIFLPAKAEALPLPADVSVVTPVPAPVVLDYSIGTLPPGGYLGVFLMNEFPYEVESFVIDDPGPPIAADVEIEINQDDPANTIAVVNIEFESPHLITERDIHRRGNYFILQATAQAVDTSLDPVAALVPVPQRVTLRYPLGELPTGSYGAAFVMNGYPYESTTWTEPDRTFEADVRLAVTQADNGEWTAHARIVFENPLVRITDPGTVVFNGPIIMIDATAELATPGDGTVAPAAYELDYALGQLPAGPKWLKYFINSNFEAQLDFSVPPIPAKVDLEVDASGQPVTATATIKFRDHYAITSQSVRRFGNFIVLLAEAEGPLPILAPIPPPPTVLDYDLGNLARGNYLAIFVMNNHIYEVEPFQVLDSGWTAEVDLGVTVSDAGVVVHATVDIDDPYVIVTDPGTPVITGNDIKINATAQRVVFIQPPSGDPQEFDYDLGQLPPGEYTVVYCLNNNKEARLRFRVPPPCNPLPHVAGIRVGEESQHWFSRVVLALLPGQEVTDWGVVRQSGQEFHVNVSVECVPYPTAPVPVDAVLPGDPDLPDGVSFDVAGVPHIGGSPIRLVAHTYRLGPLNQGKYKFCVHSRGQTLACKRFKVPGAPPRVTLDAGNITEATSEHRFGISFHDPTGLDHDSIMNARVWIVGPDYYLEQAQLLSYASTDDVPSTGASARYAVNGPGGSWDHPDNGRYRVFIEADKVRDLDGNALEDPFLGRFAVRILPDPPEPGVNVSVAMNPAGEWEATVEIISEPGQQVVVDSWGPVIYHGQSFIALASVHIEPTNGPVEPVAHIYNLGVLQPGYYVFVFKTNLAHCGIADFTVPGLEGPTVARWQANVSQALGGVALADGDDNSALAEYFFGLSPAVHDSPVLAPEIVTMPGGEQRLGIRFQRVAGAEGVLQTIQGSQDLSQWDDMDGGIELMERITLADGMEEVLFCLDQSLTETPYRFLRIQLVEDQE